MVKLYQFKPMWGLPNASPPCMKLETYLRMAKIPFEIVPNADLRKAPKRKMPYIEDQGMVMGDSNLIIEYLKSKYGDSLDQHLTPAEKATVLAFRRMIEENLYWVGVYCRWEIPENFEKVKKAFFDFLPFPMNKIIPIVAHKGMRKQLHGHGMGRHTPEEILEIGKRDLTALSHFLGEKPFFMGNQPTTLDAASYGSLANILWVPIESPIKDHAKKLKNLEEFCLRMKERFYPELKK